MRFGTTQSGRNCECDTFHQPSSGRNFLLLLNASPRIWRAMEEFHFRLSIALARRGIGVVIIVSNPIPTEVKERLELSGATVLNLTYRKRCQFLRGLRHIISDNGIETVHIRFFNHNHLIHWIVRAIGVRRILYTEANIGPASGNGIGASIRRLRARVLTFPLSRLIAISQFVKDRLTSLGIPEQKIEVIYNGVDLDRFSPCQEARKRFRRHFNVPSGTFVLSTISRFTRQKRIDTLIRACKDLHADGLSFRFFIAGNSGPEEQYLQRLISQLGIDHCVTWLGETPSPEFLLRGSDVFLLGTDCESFGNVIIEAMAAGVPVVCNGTGAFPELLTDGKEGLIAHMGDSSSYAKCIKRICEDHGLRNRMHAFAQERAAEYSVDEAVKRTVQLYEELTLIPRHAQ